MWKIKPSQNTVIPGYKREHYMESHGNVLIKLKDNNHWTKKKPWELTSKFQKFKKYTKFQEEKDNSQ
jgi:hypothetical protein